MAEKQLQYEWKTEYSANTRSAIFTFDHRAVLVMPGTITENATMEGRIVKRQKKDNQVSHVSRTPGASRLFAPYRTVGLVSPTSVPFTSIPLGKTTFQITTSVGRSLQTFDLRRGLNLVFITRPQTPSLITASTAWKDLVFAAWGGEEAGHDQGVWVFKRGKKIDDLEIPSGLGEAVQSLAVFGSWIVGCCRTKLVIWKSSTYEHYTTLASISGAVFTGCVSSIPTLLNKILVGKDDGSLELWNVSSGKLVFTILPPSADFGAVTAIEPAPVVSLVAIGYNNGSVQIHDVRSDRQIMHFNASETAVTSISFRTDGLGAGDDGRKSGVMATASLLSGDVTLWDLNNGGRKAGVLRGAHAAPSKGSNGGVSKIEFLPSQAIIVTSGLDNSLRTWIFDETPFSPIPRPLHARSGHGAPVTTLAFLPSASDGSDMSGKWLLAASQDRSLWGWSLRRDGQSSELSQGAIQKKAKKAGILSSQGRDAIEALKAPPITCIASSLNRDGGMGAIPGKHPIWQASDKRKGPGDTETSNTTGWESVVTAHAGDSKARTWFWGRKRAGRWAFETGDHGEVKSVAISPCGTFALVGSAAGGIDMFNLQSGIHRQRYPPRLTPQQAKQLKLDVMRMEEEIEVSGDSKGKKYFRGQGKHNAAVTGLAVDNLNRTVISSGAEGKIKFWDFKTGALKHELDWSAAVSILALRFHRSSELVAFSCSDGCIRVVDTSTYKLVRELRISRDTTKPISRCQYVDFSFSEDGRWISAATSSFVCVWDLPTGHLIDAFKLPAECNALAFSPTGEYIATATSDSVGIDIFTNRTLFTHVPTRHISETELDEILTSTTTLAPTASGEGSQNILTGADDSETDDIDIDLDLDMDADPTTALTSSLVSLSLVPRSRWQNLLHLDLIRARNKPIAPPKKPEAAPFFLPSLQERQTLLSASTSTDLVALEAERSRIMRMDRASNASRFTTLLHSCDQAGEYADFLALVRELNPAAADVEIRSLARATEGGVDELVAFVQALRELLASKRDFELGQAWMSVFLRLHGDVVVEDEELRDVVSLWRDEAREEKERVGNLAEYCGGLVNFLRAGRV